MFTELIYNQVSDGSANYDFLPVSQKNPRPRNMTRLGKALVAFSPGIPREFPVPALLDGNYGNRGRISVTNLFWGIFDSPGIFREFPGNIIIEQGEFWEPSVICPHCYHPVIKDKIFAVSATDVTVILRMLIKSIRTQVDAIKIIDNKR